MRNIAFILAIHFAVCSLQPAWQPLSQWLANRDCGQTCSIEMVCAADGIPNRCPTEDDGTQQGACSPFQCCFPCCCYCCEINALEAADFIEITARPSGEAGLFPFSFIADCFHPPEAPALA